MHVTRASSAPRGGLGEVLHTRSIHCLDTKVSEVCFFLQSTQSILVAAPLDSQRQQELHWERAAAWQREGMDLDFGLFEETATSADASTTTAADRNPRVDYALLSSHTMPARRAGESIHDRAQALHGWIERCFATSAATNVGERLGKVSARLAFEHDSYLSTLALPDGSRCVRGLVVPARSGAANHATVVLAIPLLLTQQSTVLSTVHNILSLYAKFTNLAFHKPQHIVSLSIDLCIQLLSQGSPQDSRLSVQTERLAVHVEDTAKTSESPVNQLLQNLVDFRSLPQLSNTLRHGDSFMDYIPKLEAALLHNLRHPLHFLSLVLGLSASLGSPIELCPAATMDPSAQALSLLPLVRTAAFCVVDRHTQVSFMIGLHYYTGRELPSIGIVANQYTSVSSRAAPLRSKVRYAEGAAEGLSLDKDGFLQVEELSRVVTAGIMEALSRLMASFSS